MDNYTVIRGTQVAIRDLAGRPDIPDFPKRYWVDFDAYRGFDEFWHDNFPDTFRGYSMASDEFVPGPDPLCSREEFRRIAVDVEALIKEAGVTPLPLADIRRQVVGEYEIGFTGIHEGFNAGFFTFSALPRHSHATTKPLGSPYSDLIGACYLAVAHHLGEERAGLWIEEGCWGLAVSLYRQTFPERKLPQELVCSHSSVASLESRHI